MAETKTEGAYKGGDGNYYFNVDELKGLDAGPGYAVTFGPVIEGERIQVGVMKLPSGQSSKPHTHPNEQWIYLLAGELDSTIDGQKRRVKPGEIAYIPANIVHSVSVISDEDAQFFTCKDMSHGIAGKPVE